MHVIINVSCCRRQGPHQHQQGFSVKEIRTNLFNNASAIDSQWIPHIKEPIYPNIETFRFHTRKWTCFPCRKTTLKHDYKTSPFFLFLSFLACNWVLKTAARASSSFIMASSSKSSSLVLPCRDKSPCWAKIVGNKIKCLTVQHFRINSDNHHVQSTVDKPLFPCQPQPNQERLVLPPWMPRPLHQQPLPVHRLNCYLPHHHYHLHLEHHSTLSRMMKQLCHKHVINNIIPINMSCRNISFALSPFLSLRFLNLIWNYFFYHHNVMWSWEAGDAWNNQRHVLEEVLEDFFSFIISTGVRNCNVSFVSVLPYTTHLFTFLLLSFSHFFT